jgi:outer membrane lipoprotein
MAHTLLSTLALLVTLAGYASTQEAENEQAPTFLRVKTAPDSLKGQSTVIGGKVLKARRQKDRTKIEILQLPRSIDASRIRFDPVTRPLHRSAARISRSRDPPPEARISVTGIVSGSITLPLDETDYTYPVIDIKRVQVWAGPEDVARRANPYYYGARSLSGPLLAAPALLVSETSGTLAKGETSPRIHDMLYLR